jgi:hypothetical protein
MILTDSGMAGGTQTVDHHQTQSTFHVRPDHKEAEDTVDRARAH